MADQIRIRRSKQREIILEELMKLGSHPSADELYDRVRKRLPHISLGTVYRNLEILSREGVIRRLALDGPRMRFDGGRDEHHHIRCIRCGRVDDVPAPAAASESERSAARRTGYLVVERRVQYLGVCPACRRKDRVS
ncbi:MAG: transcriptional repressor [Candidatus Latescibacterota bacterium]|jgi:Fur family ferric uptake transcriptional regulator|nr:MAG: transcriptional repressor [Candidatus Latescibacterota bacterium]